MQQPQSVSLCYMSKAVAADLLCLLVVMKTTYAVIVIQSLATEHLLVRILS